MNDKHVRRRPKSENFVQSQLLVTIKRRLVTDGVISQKDATDKSMVWCDEVRNGKRCN
jgi:hypothetical protein